MPRFVVLTHDYPFPHWDLMLEVGSMLRTWRLLQSPDSPGSIQAEALPDHRLHYLEYEGPVSGERGTVKQWDRGRFTQLAEVPDRVEFRLEGTLLTGRYVLALEETETRWRLYSAND